MLESDHCQKLEGRILSLNLSDGDVSSGLPKNMQNDGGSHKRTVDLKQCLMQQLDEGRETVG
jgi:hypothetical protein